MVNVVCVWARDSSSNDGMLLLNKCKLWNWSQEIPIAMNKGQICNYTLKIRRSGECSFMFLFYFSNIKGAVHVHSAYNGSCVCERVVKWLLIGMQWYNSTLVPLWQWQSTQCNYYTVRYNNIFTINISNCHFKTNHHHISWMQLKSQWPWLEFCICKLQHRK